MSGADLGPSSKLFQDDRILRRMHRDRLKRDAAFNAGAMRGILIGSLFGLVFWGLVGVAVCALVWR